MVQILVVLVTVAVPALVALGSSARRRLSLIRDEIKTLNALPEGHPGREVLSTLIESSVSDYRASRGNSAARLRLYVVVPLLSVGYVMSVFGAVTSADLFSGSRVMIDDRDTARTVSTVLLIAGPVFMGLALAALCVINRRTGKSTMDGVPRFFHSRRSRATGSESTEPHSTVHAK